MIRSRSLSGWRRHALRLGVLALVLSALPGCQDTAVLLFDHRMGRESPAAEVQPLRFATSQTAETWNPLLRGGLHEGTVLVHAALFDRDPVTKALREDLVQRAAIDATDRTLDLFLREARFHDGRAVRAEDVIASLEAARSADARPGLRAALLAVGIVRMEAEDDRTLSLQLTGSAAALRELLPAIAILPADRPEGLVGAGPFVLLGGSGGIYDLLAFEGWHRGPPRLGRIELHTGVHPEQQARGIVRGELDIALLPGASWLRAEERRAFATEVRPSDELVLLGGGPLGIDRRAWMEAGFAGRAGPAELGADPDPAAPIAEGKPPAADAGGDLVLEALAAASEAPQGAEARPLLRGPFPRGLGGQPDRMLIWLDRAEVAVQEDLVQACLADGRSSDAGRTIAFERALEAQGLHALGRFDWLLVITEEWQPALPPGPLGTLAIARSLPEWAKL